jgi:hypothetical protein
MLGHLYAMEALTAGYSGYAGSSGCRLEGFKWSVNQLFRKGLHTGGERLMDSDLVPAMSAPLRFDLWD